MTTTTKRLDTTTMPPPDTHYSDPASGQRMPAFGLRHLDEAYAEIDRLRGLLERVYRLHPSTLVMIDDADATRLVTPPDGLRHTG